MATRSVAGPGRGSPRGRVPGIRDRRPSVAHGGAAVSRPRRQRGSAPHRARLRGRGMILCRTLGPVAVSVDGGSAPPELLWRKNLALLLYLARSPKRARAWDGVLRRADELLGTGDLPGAHAGAQRALLLDPTSDVAVRGLMRCRALAGDRAGALECYETFAARLAGEVDTEPDTDTKALAERVRRGRAWRLPAGAGGAGGGGGAGGAAAGAGPAPHPGRGGAGLPSGSWGIKGRRARGWVGRGWGGWGGCARRTGWSSSWTMPSGSTASRCSHSSGRGGISLASRSASSSPPPRARRGPSWTSCGGGLDGTAPGRQCGPGRRSARRSAGPPAGARPGPTSARP